MSSPKPPAIPLVIDRKFSNKTPIHSHAVFQLRELHEVTLLRVPSEQRYFCYNCGDPVTVISRVNNKNEDSHTDDSHTYYFRHKQHYGENCDWKVDEGNSSRSEIHKGLQEGSEHYEMKLLLAKTLNALPDWHVADSDIDQTFLFTPDRRLRGKPDIKATYKGKRSVVFEIQLHSETVETIVKRKELYSEIDHQLIWLSISNEERNRKKGVSAKVDVRQVQIDIAFSNNGNWFEFNEDMAEEAIQNQELMIMARFYEHQRSGNYVDYVWSKKLVPYSSLQYENNETFYYDFNSVESSLKEQLKEVGRGEVLRQLEVEKPQDRFAFYQLAKKCWPTLSQDEEQQWLDETFDIYDRDRHFKMKWLIIKYFILRSCNSDENIERWKKLEAAGIDHNLGMFKDMPVDVIEKMLLILGYSLSEHVSIAHKWHIRSAHFFYDESRRFIGYKDFCRKVIENSWYREDILSAANMQKRLKNPDSDHTQTNSLDQFLDWFVSEPSIHPDRVSYKFFT